MSPNASAKPPKPSRSGTAPAADRRIDAGVPELVVRGALARIGQDLVGFLRFLEFLFRRLVVRIAIRMVLHRELAIRLLEVVVGGVAIDAEHRVVITFGHGPVQPLCNSSTWNLPSVRRLTKAGNTAGNADSTNTSNT